MPKLPNGFVLLREGSDLLLLRAAGGPRRQLAETLVRFLSGTLAGPRRSLPGGRGEAVAVEVAGWGRVVLRRSLRGGLPRHFIRDAYVGRPRPFLDVAAGEELRRRGIAVPESLGAIVRVIRPFCYRGAVATREVCGSVNLWDYLRAQRSVERRRQACRAVARLIRQLHAARAFHPDLNLTNFLIGNEAGKPVVWVIDCDRVRLRAAGRLRRSLAWRRVRRSARRLDPQAAVVDPAWFGARKGGEKLDVGARGATAR